VLSLPGTVSQKQPKNTHSRERFRKLLKSFYVHSFIIAVTSAVLICKWTLNLYDDDAMMTMMTFIDKIAQNTCSDARFA